jgi:hypothetical protein
MADGQAHGPGTELSLPVEEVRALMKRGVLLARKPALLPPAEYNPGGIGMQGANAQGPRYR